MLQLDIQWPYKFLIYHSDLTEHCLKKYIFHKAISKYMSSHFSNLILQWFKKQTILCNISKNIKITTTTSQHFLQRFLFTGKESFENFAIKYACECSKAIVIKLLCCISMHFIELSYCWRHALLVIYLQV